MSTVFINNQISKWERLTFESFYFMGSFVLGYMSILGRLIIELKAGEKSKIVNCKTFQKSLFVLAPGKGI